MRVLRSRRIYATEKSQRRSSASGLHRRNTSVGVVRAFAHGKRDRTVRGNQAAENLQFFRLISLAGGSPCAGRAKPESGVARERPPSNHGHGSSFLQSPDGRSCENSNRRVYSVDSFESFAVGRVSGSSLLRSRRCAPLAKPTFRVGFPLVLLKYQAISSISSLLVNRLSS